MRKSKWIALAMTGLFPLAAAAEVQTFTDKEYHFKVGFELPQYNLTLAGADREVKFEPNLLGALSAGVYVRDMFGFSFGLPLPQDKEERAQKGSTKYTDLRFSFAFEQFHLSLQYGQYRGFFVEDTAAFDNTWHAGDPFYHADELEARTLAANFTWVFTPESYSLIAAMDQTQRQQEPGGSWLAGASLTDTLFSDSREILPPAAQLGYGADATIKEGHFTALSAKGGYGYTWTFGEKWFLSGALQGGYGVQKMSVSGTGFDRDRLQATVKVDLFASLGWNGDDHYFGLGAIGDLTKFETGESSIDSTFVTVKMFYGFRL